MRELADAARVRSLMRALGAAADGETTAYLRAAARLVLCGWRETTIDVDIVFVPESDSLLRAIPQLKEELRVNVELASPADFIPVPVGWEDRSPFVAREGRITFRHFDLYSQALAKLERGHDRDLADVRAMLAAGLVESGLAMALFGEIEERLYRFPAIDPPSFRLRVEQELGHP